MLRTRADMQRGWSIRGPEVRHRWGLMGRWTITLLICPFAESSQPVRATLSPPWWEEARSLESGAITVGWCGIWFSDYSPQTSVLHDRMWKLTWISAWGPSLQGFFFPFIYLFLANVALHLLPRGPSSHRMQGGQWRNAALAPAAEFPSHRVFEKYNLFLQLPLVWVTRTEEQLTFSVGAAV